MAKEKAEKTYRSSEEARHGASDGQHRPSMSGETPSASHSSTSRNDRKLSSCRTPASPSQSTSGRDTDTGSIRSQSFSYGIGKWLNQTPQEEPWNAAGCSQDFYCKETTNEDSSATRRSANEGKNGNGGH